MRAGQWSGLLVLLGALLLEGGCASLPPRKPLPPEVEAARRLREAAEELEAAQVEAARKAGATWIEIGACYGLTKQGAQQRFRAAHNQVKAVTAGPGTKKTEPMA